MKREHWLCDPTLFLCVALQAVPGGDGPWKGPTLDWTWDRDSIFYYYVPTPRTVSEIKQMLRVQRQQTNKQNTKPPRKRCPSWWMGFRAVKRRGGVVWPLCFEGREHFTAFTEYLISHDWLLYCLVWWVDFLVACIWVYWKRREYVWGETNET